MKRNINRTPIIGISLPWSLEEWSKSKVAEVCADWRFPAFLDEWKREILKNKPSIDVYLALAICTPKSCPKSLRDLYENQERFMKIMQRLRRRVLSVNEIERILNRCTEIISLTPQFFPCSALTFEFLTVVIDFSEFAIKKFKHSNAAKLKDNCAKLHVAAVGLAVCALNEQFGISKEQRLIPRGRIAAPPGRRGFSHYCPLCMKVTRQKVLFSYINPRVDAEIPTEYTLTECAKCGEPGLFMREDEGWGFLAGTEYHLWRGEKRKLGGIVPYAAHAHYKRAVDYEKEQKWDAVVLEVGRTLEAIVKIMEPSSKNLGDGIDKLSAAKIITADLKDWTTELRTLRNLSAHASGKSFSRHEAESAFDFLDAIIETTFWTRSMFNRFREERVRTSTRSPISSNG